MRTRMGHLPILVLALAASCAWPAAAGEIGFWDKITKTDMGGGISVGLNEGIFIDDFRLTNNSQTVAEGVSIELTVFGINGDYKKLKEYWGIWRPGESKTISAATVTNVQRVDVKLSANGCYADRTYYFSK